MRNGQTQHTVLGAPGKTWCHVDEALLTIVYCERLVRNLAIQLIIKRSSLINQSLYYELVSDKEPH